MKFLGGMFATKLTPAQRAARQEPLSDAAVARRVREAAQERADARAMRERYQASADEIATSCKFAGHWWPRRSSHLTQSRLNPKPTVGDRFAAMFDQWKKGY